MSCGLRFRGNLTVFGLSLMLWGAASLQRGAVARAQPAAPSSAPIVDLPVPTPAQQRALQVLETEWPEYERQAQQFRRTLGDIVRHHHEGRRQRVLDVLDQKVKAQNTTVVRTRNAAIARYEQYISKYSGKHADPKATPEALYRLAALYEERARESQGDLPAALRPAIEHYRRILTEFPDYQQIVGVHYYLGHALSDAGRIDEGQQVWRALACSNRFLVQNSAKDKTKIALQPLLQDRDAAFWNEWALQHPVPLDLLPPRQRASRRWQKASVAASEERFVDPYQDCTAVPQVALGEQEVRYLAETWWQIGNHHFDQLDPYAGPYFLNRAVSAYERALQHKLPPLYGVALYKRAWAHFRQQRYRSAIEWFVNLLHYADEQQLKTGDPGADFRTEAYAYIAGALTFADLEGAPADHPFIARSDGLDNETDAGVAAQRMAIAINRVQDNSLVPQEKKWAVEIYKALAQEFIELNQNRNAITVLELALHKFPLHRDAPKLQTQVAELYEQLARAAPDDSPLQHEHKARALNARTALAQYVGATLWAQANKADVEALQVAAELVARNLQRVSAERTNTARALSAKATQKPAGAERNGLVEAAIAEYRHAATGWAAYVAQDPSGADSYESQFWLSDARFQIVALQIELAGSPTATEVEAARNAARAVRDSNEDDKYLQPAAHYLVTLADLMLQVRYRDHENSGGMLGFAKRQEVEFKGDGLSKRAVQVKLPDEVMQAILARDEYNRRIPYANDPQKNGVLYAVQAADHLFVYGQFAQAKERFDALMAENCGRNEWGFSAWEKLVSMSNFQGDAQQSRKLVEEKSCAFDDETRAAEDSIRKPVRQGVAYLEARTVYEQAERLPPSRERDQEWRKAAGMYKVALDAAPDRDEAPEAAMNGAFAYKQVGEYSKAIEMYELFIARYGAANTLRALKEGDATAKPPKSPEPRRYEARTKFLKLAYDALSNAYLLFFDYPKAAQTLTLVSQGEHFAAHERRAAAQQALNLYLSLGENQQTQKSRDALIALGASPQEQALADFAIAKASLKHWDTASPNTGSNKAARDQAESQMRAYYDRYAQDPSAAEYLLEAAYWVAKLKRVAADRAENQWWARTEQAFVLVRDAATRSADGSSSALGSRLAAFAAEGAFLQLDDAIKESFDRDAEQKRLSGTPTQIIEQFQRAAENAQGWYDRLQVVIDEYAAPEWATQAIARQGSLYDALRMALYSVRPPELEMFDRKTEALLLRAEQSDNPALQERADAIRTSIESSWQARRDQELDSADRVVVDRYSRAIIWARRFNVSTTGLAKAIARMAYLSDVLGEARLRQYTAAIPQLGYSEGLFVRMRPGLVATPPLFGVGNAAPVAVPP